MWIFLCVQDIPEPSLFLHTSELCCSYGIALTTNQRLALCCKKTEIPSLSSWHHAQMKSNVDFIFLTIEIQYRNSSKDNQCSEFGKVITVESRFLEPSRLFFNFVITWTKIHFPLWFSNQIFVFLGGSKMWDSTEKETIELHQQRSETLCW